MYGQGSLGETALGESVEAGEPIIPEIVTETKQLVFVVEIEMSLPGTEEIIPPPEPLPPLVVNAGASTLTEGF
jgi:hypothetical protein